MENQIKYVGGPMFQILDYDQDGNLEKSTYAEWVYLERPGAADAILAVIKIDEETMEKTFSLVDNCRETMELFRHAQGPIQIVPYHEQPAYIQKAAEGVR